MTGPHSQIKSEKISTSSGPFIQELKNNSFNRFQEFILLQYLFILAFKK